MLLIAVILLASLTNAADAANHGLTAEERAQFKPLNATRVEINNTGEVGLVNISDPGSDKSYFTMYTNSVPSHSTIKWPRKESGISDEDMSMMQEMGMNDSMNGSRPMMTFQPLQVFHAAWRIPKEPSLRSHPIMCVGFGVVGLSTGGVTIYNAYVPRKTCPFAQLQEEDDFDDCSGHTDPKGGYHYHGHSSCNRMEVCGEPSKIFGVALDGIPMYGPIDEFGKQLTQTDLDICGGRTGSDGRYRYHITADAPFLLNCFRGEIHKELLNDPDFPQRDHFSCNCPFDDSSYPDCFEDPFCTDDDDKYTLEERKTAEAAFRAKERVSSPKSCKWNTTGDFAECSDVINSTYTPGFRQIRKKSSANLIPCCPKGDDCGESCVGNDQCYVENREGMYLVIELLSTGNTNSARGLGVVLGLYCVILLRLFMN